MEETPLSSSPERQLTARTIPADEPLRALPEPGVSEGFHVGETRILEMIARGHSLPQVLDALTRFIESQADGTHCAIAFVDAELRIRPASAPTLPSEYNGQLDGVPIFPYIGPCGMAAYLKQQVISQSIEADDRWSDAFRSLTRQHGLKACWSTPIFDSRASCIGTFAIYMERPCAPTAHHLGLIEIATRLAGIAIERQLKEERLHVFAEVISRSTEAIRISDHNDRTMEQNAAHREMFGFTDDELKGQTSAVIFGEGQSARVLANLNEQGQFNGELVATIDGKPRPIDVWAFVVMNKDKKTVCHVALNRDVTEKRQAEEALKDSHAALESLVAQRTAALQQAFDEISKSEAKLRRVIDTIPTLAGCSLPDGSGEFWNQRWHDYTGLSPDAARGWGWREVVHPEDLRELNDKWLRDLASGQPGEAEGRLRRFDGEYRWFLFRYEPLHDETGNILNWYGTYIDIEDRKRAEDLLAGEKRLLEMVARGRSMAGILEALCQLVESTASGCYCSVVLVDPTGTRLEHGAAPTLPASFITSIIGRPVNVDSGPCAMAAFLDEQVIAPDLRSETRWAAYEWCPMALAHGLQACWSTPIASTAGKVLGAFALYYDEPRMPTSLHQSLIEQFTHIASIAIEAAQNGAALKRSEAFLAEGQRLGRFGNLSWRVATDEITCSDEIYRIFGFDQDVPITLEQVITRVHPEDCPMFNDMIQRARAAVSDFEYEHRLLMPDHTLKCVHLMAHGTRDNQGQLEYIGAVQDVTQRRLSEEALARAHSQLARVARVNSLGVLSASIAHEVNQPLSGIITNASTCLRMLSGDPPNVDGARETARRTIRDGHRASDVITRLRTLYSKKDPAPELMDLNEAAREVTSLSLRELQQNRVILRHELANDLPKVTADLIQLQQVILNLLRNASDAMSTVEDRPRDLVVRTERDGADRVRFCVKDAGVGLDRQSVGRLFEAFFTTKSDGMGIGLSISRSIIEAHGGRLWATANDGPGATFSFSIPCSHAGVPAARTAGAD